MKLNALLAQVGGEYDEVLGRFPTEGMLRKYLFKFLEDPSYQELKEALEEGDWTTAFRESHTLKGIGANLGLGDLTEAVTVLTETLRGAAAAPPAEQVEAVERTYAAAVAAIRQLE